jgi:hypothetical protein
MRQEVQAWLDVLQSHGSIRLKNMEHSRLTGAAGHISNVTHLLLSFKLQLPEIANILPNTMIEEEIHTAIPTL